MGFTLRAAPAAVGPGAQLVVAEIMPELVDWAEGPMEPIFGDSLADPRVEIRVGDVSEMIRAASDAYDAILLDVDNGPRRLTRAGNDGLHDERGLRAAHRALASGGVVAVWSAGSDPTFTRRQRACGFDVGGVHVRARPGGRGARHTIWLATRPCEADDRLPAARR
jgi:spermidine synthase